MREKILVIFCGLIVVIGMPVIWVFDFIQVGAKEATIGCKGIISHIWYDEIRN